MENWQHVKDASEWYQNDMMEQIRMTTAAAGFFSVWMAVFEDEPQILLELIERFPGTDRAYYDEHGKIKQILLKTEENK